jgi:hypothetical protein
VNFHGAYHCSNESVRACVQEGTPLGYGWSESADVICVYDGKAYDLGTKPGFGNDDKCYETLDKCKLGTKPSTHTGCYKDGSCCADNKSAYSKSCSCSNGTLSSSCI